MIDGLQNKAYLSKQKSILLAEKGRLEKELEKVSKFPDYGNSEDSNAQEVEQFTENNDLEKKIRGSLSQIVKALKKLEIGEYGICIFCGRPIERGRLKVLSSAQTCVGCSDKV